MLKYVFLTTLAVIFLFIVLLRFTHKKKLAENSELVKRLKESEESYRFLAEKYEAVVSNIREVILQVDSYGKLIYLNNSWVKLTGFSIEESIGKKIHHFFSPIEMRGLTSHIKSKMLSGEIQIKTKDRKRKIIEFTMLPLFSTSGDMIGYSGSINDITERKEQEHYNIQSKQYVEKLNQELEKRVQEEVYKNRQKDHILIEQSRLAAMGEMIASIGHQWRQPLNNLALLIQDVSEALEFGELDDQYITRFSKESMALIKHMSQTINDFREFYLPNKEKAFFSLAESIEDALSIFSISLKNHNIHVKFEYRGQYRAFGFHNEFSQAILNILTNARDAFVENEVANRIICIEIEEVDLFYVTKMTDNAGGIASNLMEKIFEPYYTTRPNGTGLGLYMTKMIVENMHGDIKVENIDSGVRFLLSVPKGLSAAVQEPA